MHIEIERKFLVTSNLYRKFVTRTMEIRQGYISTSGKGEVRVSIRDEKAWIVVKSRGTLSRQEYEFSIPKETALELLDCMCNRVIYKTRYIIPIEGSNLYWEVDEFHGEDNGLVLAEIEIPCEDYELVFPEWIGKEVTDDSLYYNSTLSQSNYKTLISKRHEAEAWDSWRDSLVRKW